MSDNYLEHNIANVVDALCDRLPGARDRDGPLRGIRQHVRGNLDRNAGDLADLLNLRAPLADEGAALTRGHDQPQRDRRPRDSAATASAAATIHILELGTPLRAPPQHKHHVNQGEKQTSTL